jgi:nucleoside-diphosphate-sugar epimerase
MAETRLPWRALVTGATGCIGREIVRLLLEHGHQVSVLVRDRSRLQDALGKEQDHPRLQVIEGDLREAESLNQSAIDVDVVFHTAAAVHLSPATQNAENEFYRVNLEGTRNLLRALDKSRLMSFVYLSTIAVYGNRRGILDETTAVHPETPYGKSKYEAETFVASELSTSGVRPVILRLPLVYGPGDRGNLLNMMNAIDRGRFILLDGGKAKKSVLFSRDAAKAAIRAASLDGSRGTILLVADPQPYQVRELAEEISKALGKKRRFFSVPSGFATAALSLAEEVMRMMRMRPLYDPGMISTLTSDRVCDVSKMSAVLDFAPETDLRSGIARTAQWLRESKKTAAEDL